MIRIPHAHGSLTACLVPLLLSSRFPNLCESIQGLFLYDEAANLQVLQINVLWCNLLSLARNLMAVHSGTSVWGQWVCALRAACAAQGGFDEAAQKITEVIPREQAPTQSYVVHVCQFAGRPDKTVISLAHSLIHTLRMSCWTAKGQFLDVQDALIPPLHVEAQDAITITKAFIYSLPVIVMNNM